MKLCAIYNVWDDWDLVINSIENIRPIVDSIIVVYSHRSNYDELHNVETFEKYFNSITVGKNPVYMANVEPDNRLSPQQNETRKRNEGIEYAKAWTSATHFIMMDADEFYDAEEFLREKERFHVNPNLAGLVCITQVYVKSPTLTIGYDTTLVPFIHKITPGLKHEFNKSYPFAWEGKNLRIDPTRSLNINSGVEWSDITMHHYSWVRKDIEKKIRNSTARANLQKMNLANKFVHLKEGDIFDLYPNKPLVRVQARFNVPDYGVVQDLQPSTGSGTNSKPV